MQEERKPVGWVGQRRVALWIGTGRACKSVVVGSTVESMRAAPVTWLRSLDSAQAARVGRRSLKEPSPAARPSSASESPSSSSRGTSDQASSVETIVSNSSRATARRGSE